MTEHEKSPAIAPVDADRDDAMRLDLRMKAEKGLAAIDAGETLTRDEVAAEIKHWRKSAEERRSR